MNIDKEKLRAMLIDYSMGGSVTSSAIAQFINNRDENEVSNIIGIWDKEFRELPCDEEGPTEEQEQAMTDNEDLIIQELLKKK